MVAKAPAVCRSRETRPARDSHAWHRGFENSHFAIGAAARSSTRVGVESVATALDADPCGTHLARRGPNGLDMGERGFEPLKAEPTGLQPVPFGHLGTPPAVADCS